jgi:hypothetical protein
MNIIRLYYITGTMFILLTIILSIFSMLSLESMLVFALAGVLLFAIGLVQHMLLLNEKLHQLKNLQTHTP